MANKDISNLALYRRLQMGIDRNLIQVNPPSKRKIRPRLLAFIGIGRMNLFTTYLIGEDKMSIAELATGIEGPAHLVYCLASWIWPIKKLLIRIESPINPGGS